MTANAKFFTAPLPWKEKYRQNEIYYQSESTRYLFRKAKSSSQNCFYVEIICIMNILYEYQVFNVTDMMAMTVHFCFIDKYWSAAIECMMFFLRSVNELCWSKSWNISLLRMKLLNGFWNRSSGKCFCGTVIENWWSRKSLLNKKLFQLFSVTKMFVSSFLLMKYWFQWPMVSAVTSFCSSDSVRKAWYLWHFFRFEIRPVLMSV